MGKWVLYTQSNYAYPKPTQTQTCPFDTPNGEGGTRARNLNFFG